MRKLGATSSRADRHDQRLSGLANGFSLSSATAFCVALALRVGYPAVVTPPDKTRGEAFSEWFSRLKASHWWVLGSTLLLGFGAGMWFEKRFPEQREHTAVQDRAQPFASPSIRKVETVVPSPNASARKTRDTTEIGMSVQEFSRKYASLEGRFAEREAFVRDAVGERVKWVFAFHSPVTHANLVQMHFRVPPANGKSDPDLALQLSPIRWATFPLSLRDRIYGLRSGDLITITGNIGESLGTIFIDGEDFHLLEPGPTP